MLEQCKRLVNGIDYQSANVRRLEKSTHGGIIPKQYIMTPKTFFMCLVRSKNSSVYAEYYFHVLEIYNYYEEYFTKMYKENLRSVEEERDSLEDDVLDREKKVDILEDLLEEVKKQGEEARKRDVVSSQQSAILMQALNVILNKATETEAALVAVGTELEATKAEMVATNTKLDKVLVRLPDCANKPPKKSQLEWLSIMHKPNTKYLYVIRTQLINLESARDKIRAKGYVEIDALPKTELVPNSVTLWNVAREKMVIEKMIKCNRNNIILQKPYSLSDFVKRLNTVFESRKDY